MKQEYLQELGLSPETAGQIAAEFARELDQARGEWETALANERKEGAVQIALAQAGAKNLKAARALVTLDPDAALSPDGTLPGLAEQIEALKNQESTAFLFAGTQPPQLTGFRPAEGLSPGEGGSGEALTLAQAIEQSMQTTDNDE